MKYILLKKGRSSTIEQHDLFNLYEMLDKEIQDKIKCILINQPKKFQPLYYEQHTWDHYIEQLKKNRSLVMYSRYYYENYEKEFWIYFGGIYEIIKAFRTYAHDYVSLSEKRL